MCTAFTFKGKDNYFGRTLDVEIDYKTSVIVTPRNYDAFSSFTNNYAIIGMAIDFNHYPLYFDATNECGLAMAGLNFPGNAIYNKRVDCKLNLDSYELIPYILGKCKNVFEAKDIIENLNITDGTFGNMPSSPLHWIVSDGDFSITFEQTKSGLKVYDNPLGILTNNPEFPWHMTNLTNYMNITEKEATNNFSKTIDLKPFCKGMGGIGLPGDLSSPSRFIRIAFAKEKALSYDTEEKNVSQFFHIAENVSQTTGLAQAGDSYEETLYTSCININKGIYYYKTYFNSSITSVDINKCDLNGKTLFVYPVDYDTKFIKGN